MSTAIWEHLPGPVRAAVEARTGTVLTAEPVTAGRNNHLAAILHTRSGNTVFVKGLRSNDRRVRTQRLEVLVAPYVQRISPRLHWHITTAGWDLIGFDALTDARHVDLTPDSTDLPAVATTLHRLSLIPCPDSTLDRIERRWATWAEPAELDLISGGDDLLHTDLRPDNLLLAEGRVRIVDWAWPTRGPAWIDTACLALWLIAEGHTPAGAQGWMRTLPTGRTIRADALDAFVAINVRLWSEIASDDPQPWKVRVANAAAAWAEQRGNQ